MFGFHVSGIDYSEIGCKQAEAVLRKERVEGNVMCASFFTPSKEMVEVFDVVVSFAVTEQFDDTKACTQALSAFLKPGGMLITTVPNLKGFIGMLQKSLNKPPYDIRLPIGMDVLLDAHESSELEIPSSGYFLFAYLGGINFSGIEKNPFAFWAKKLVLFSLQEIIRVT